MFGLLLCIEKWHNPWEFQTRLLRKLLLLADRRREQARRAGPFALLCVAIIIVARRCCYEALRVTGCAARQHAARPTTHHPLRASPPVDRKPQTANGKGGRKEAEGPAANAVCVCVFHSPPAPQSSWCRSITKSVT